MRLSIFNFKPIRWTIFFLVVMVVLAGWLKMHVLHEAPKGLTPLTSAFWMAKTHTKKQFDVVLIGDSRLYRGIAPSVMQATLGNMTVFNFGFSSAGMSAVLLKGGEHKLNPNGKRIIILSLTPYSLTASAALNEQYKEYNADMDWPYQIPGLSVLLFPNETSWVVNHLLGFKMKEYYQIPHEDGWVESDNPSESVDSALHEYKQRFLKEKISPELFNYLLQQVHEWHDQGYTVFAFRPPASEKMEQLENSLSGYDEVTIKHDFTDAGGIWIDIPDRYIYQTYDGSHLKSSSAKLLSAYIGQSVKNRISLSSK